MLSPKILLIGGTGAIGSYLAPELINMGFDVFVTSRSTRVSDNNKLTYIQGNAHEEAFLLKILATKYDAIVDFMVYSTNEFFKRYELLLSNTVQYIFLSTYRVFAESKTPIAENSPRLLDVSGDVNFLATDEYALAKARQENILRGSKYKNWTIVRPTITYSKARFQLGTLEANTIIFRAQNNCPVILPQEMLHKRTTMTWAGDVAKMIALLMLNQNFFSEDFNVCTEEHQTWKSIADYYNKFIGLNVVTTNLIKYIKVVGNRYQILYDRMFDRIMDNSKILKATGMQKETLMPVYDGLSKELLNFPKTFETFKIDYIINGKMDRLTNSKIPLKKEDAKKKIVYYGSYLGIIIILKHVYNLIKKIRYSFICR